MAQCLRNVFWWDTMHVSRCVRPEQHKGWHRDGARWFDDNGYQQPSDDGLFPAVRDAFVRAGIDLPSIDEQGA